MIASTNSAFLVGTLAAVSDRSHLLIPSSTLSSLSLNPMLASSSFCSVGSVRNASLREWFADSWENQQSPPRAHAVPTWYRM